MKDPIEIRRRPGGGKAAGMAVSVLLTVYVFALVIFMVYPFVIFYKDKKRRSSGTGSAGQGDGGARKLRRGKK